MTARRAILVLAAWAVLLGGCSDDEPAAAPDAPSLDELDDVLPDASGLPLVEWDRRTAVVEGEEADDAGPLCDPDGRESRLAPVVREERVLDAAIVSLEDPDEAVRLSVLLAPLADAADLVAAAQEDVAGCSIDAGAELEGLEDWPTFGDASVAFGSDTTESGDRTERAFVVAHVGDVLVVVRYEEVFPDDDDPLLVGEEVRAFAASAVAGVKELG